MTDEPVAFLLTWNPAQMALDLENDERLLTAGRVLMGRWSVGRRSSGIRPGDDVWLFRTGREGSDPGIIRHGRAVGEVFQASHWSADRSAGGSMTNYVPLEWLEQAPGATALGRELLLREVPGPPWANLQASGIGLVPKVALRLRQVWRQHVEAVTGQAPVLQGGTREVQPEALQELAVVEELESRPPVQQFILHYLREHGAAFTADLLRVSKEQRVQGDVMLALYRLDRDGDLVREAGPPVRWTLAQGALHAPPDPSGSSPAQILELYLAAAGEQWSEAQTRAALKSPNVARMTPFSPQELAMALRDLRVEDEEDVWTSWFMSASRHRSTSIRL